MVSAGTLPVVPGPRGLERFRRLRRMQRDPLAEYMDARERFGDVVRYRAGRLLIYLVSHPDDVEHILKDNYRNYRKGVINAPLIPLLGNGLLTNEGESWLRQRRLAQPAFHRKHLSALARVMTEEAQLLVEEWRTPARSGEPVNVAAAMGRLTLAIVGRALFGTRIRATEDLLGRVFTTAAEHVNYRSRYPLSPPDWVPTPSNLRNRRAVAALDEMVNRIIQERRRSDDGEGDLLSLLLSAREEATGEGMSDRQLRDEVITFLVAGHETVANALSWTWHLLAQHPAAAARLRDEADTLLQSRLPTADDLPNLRFARMVLEESLRLYPPSVVIPRQANGPDELRGYPVPTDTAIVISQYVTHRHPDFWPDPERFLPERFAPEEAAARHRFSYIPFGGGPHICIGKDFALMEGQLVLAALAQAYEWEPVPGRPVVPEVTVTLRPGGGLWMRVRARS